MKMYFTILRKGNIIAFGMASVDNSCATTSTWKPDPGPGAVSFNN